jgi:predicted lipase
LYRDADIIITGHSLGGAMAVHCALDIKEIFGRVNALYAFGQPRVGNQNFADYTQGKISSYFRVINYQDMVPHVPQSILGFKHGGTEIWYSPRGMQTYFTCVSEDKNCSNSVSLFSMST